MIDPASLWAGYKVYSTAKKWLPYAIGGGAGLALGCLIAWAAWSWQDNRIDGLEAQVKGVSAERDTFKASADNQAAGVKARDLTIARLNAQAVLILKDWRDTRTDAAAAKAETDSLAARYAAVTAELEEKSHAEDADPAGLALDALDRLCREQGARTGTASGGC